MAHKIAIKYDKKDKVLYYAQVEPRKGNGYKVRVPPDNTVEWVCNDYPWCVRFRDEAPVSEVHVRAAAGVTASTKVERGAQKGVTHPYTVTVALDANTLYSDDPDLVIGP